MNAVEISEIVRNWAIVIGGAIGLGLAIWRGFSHDRQAKAQERQANVAQRAHITEVFTNAVALLRDEKLEIRLGAISSLARIATDYPEFSKPIVDLLQTYVRERPDSTEDVDPEIDIRVIVSFLNEQMKETENDAG